MRGAMGRKRDFLCLWDRSLRVSRRRSWWTSSRRKSGYSYACPVYFPLCIFFVRKRQLSALLILCPPVFTGGVRGIPIARQNYAREQRFHMKVRVCVRACVQASTRVSSHLIPSHRISGSAFVRFLHKDHAWNAIEAANTRQISMPGEIPIGWSHGV